MTPEEQQSQETILFWYNCMKLENWYGLEVARLPNRYHDNNNNIMIEKGLSWADKMKDKLVQGWKRVKMIGW